MWWYSNLNSQTSHHGVVHRRAGSAKQMGACAVHNPSHSQKEDSLKNTSYCTLVALHGTVQAFMKHPPPLPHNGAIPYQPLWNLPLLPPKSKPKMIPTQPGTGIMAGNVCRLWFQGGL